MDRFDSCIGPKCSSGECLCRSCEKFKRCDGGICDPTVRMCKDYKREGVPTPRQETDVR